MLTYILFGSFAVCLFSGCLVGAGMAVVALCLQFAVQQAGAGE